MDKTKIAIVGGDETLLDLFSQQETVDVVALVDGHPSKIVTTLASRHDIRILPKCEELNALDVDVIVEATADGQIKTCPSGCKPTNAEIIGEQSATLMLGLLEAAEKTNSELEKHLAEVFFIHEFFKALTTYTSSVDEVANLIADGANGILGVELSCVYSLDGDSRLQLAGFQGRTQLEFQEVWSLGEGLVGQCARDRELIYNDVQSDGESVAGFLVDSASVKMQVAVPLVVRDKLLGVLAVGQTTDRQLSDGELSRTQAIGHMASMAMQNAIFNSELERLSVTDRLTELYNHGYFQQRLEEEIALATRGDGQVSLLLFDIDYFKQFNDTFGHPKGDKVLKRIASILKEVCRLEDTVARYGGEEFVVIVPGTGKEGAAASAERVRAAIAAEIFIGDEEQPEVTKTVSIGVATYPDDAQVQSELVEKADKALYRAKDGGRNRVELA